MTRVLLETTALEGPAGGRGIGRYLTTLHAALDGFAEVSTFSLRQRTGRLAEFLDLADRQRHLRTPHDLLHVPTAYAAPAFPRGPWVCSVLDVIPLEVASHRRTGIKAAAFHRLAARASAVLTLSEHARGRIVELLGVPAERVFVAPLPARAPAVGQTGPLPTGLEPGGFALAMVDLATPDPRKRAVWLSGVAGSLAVHGVPLVVVGAGTDRAGALPGTRGLGRVDDALWGRLLRAAGVFVYTSAYEGQGLPPLEAMAAGAPVVAMANTAVEEVVADAGVLVPETLPAPAAASAAHTPDDSPVAVLADACLQVLRDGPVAAELRRRGSERAALFSVERFEAGVRAASLSALGR